MADVNGRPDSMDRLPVFCGMVTPPGGRSAGLRGNGALYFSGPAIRICLRNETVPGLFIGYALSFLLAGASAAGVLVLTGCPPSPWAEISATVTYLVFFVVEECSLQVLLRKLSRTVSVEVPSCDLGACYFQQRRVACLQLPDGAWVAVKSRRNEHARLRDHLCSFYGDLPPADELANHGKPDWP